MRLTLPGEVSLCSNTFSCKHFPQMHLSIYRFVSLFIFLSSLSLYVFISLCSFLHLSLFLSFLTPLINTDTMWSPFLRQVAASDKTNQANIPPLQCTSFVFNFTGWKTLLER